MEKNKPDSEKIDLIHDNELNACSAYDCTGLIPSAVTDDSEIEAYEEIYRYLPPAEDNTTDKK